MPFILGSELSGIVEAIGADASGFKAGDEVYGATNEQFSGAYAEYALASARMMAHKPRTLNFIEAASAPVVTVRAWQMLFEYAHVTCPYQKLHRHFYPIRRQDLPRNSRARNRAATSLGQRLNSGRATDKYVVCRRQIA